MFTMYWQGWRAETFEASTVTKRQVIVFKHLKQTNKHHKTAQN